MKPVHRLGHRLCSGSADFWSPPPAALPPIPEVRAKVAEVVEKNIKPRAQQAWQKNKPRIEAKAAELNEQIRKNATRENFDKLADKVRDRLRERSKQSY